MPTEEETIWKFNHYINPRSAMVPDYEVQWRWKIFSAPLIALIVTAVECALKDWKTGVCIPKSNQFSTDIYKPIYEHHIHNLDQFQNKACRTNLELRRSIFSGAWQQTGHSMADFAPESYLDDVDFDEMEREDGETREAARKKNEATAASEEMTNPAQ
ncbi:hypothetical protein BD410DRAFT_801770 [Rickenella mellea]|uniref:DUF6532 domain-containing protein n=1 Tax=Rickenella mellea TaxID=50990 RepID=A0A4Y7QDX9_9AGAM|nr:hypothetical protein BD410DRAFT_801770 [Rickenella mellea]